MRGVGWLWSLLKWTLFVLVLAFVGWRGWDLWQQGALKRIHVSPGWLVLAGGAYLLGWLPSVWFWRRLLRRFGARVRCLDTVRAYYCGHLGKYVPGKATVLVIRSVLLKERGVRPAVAAVTATVETVLMMAAGGVVAVALSPMLLADVESAGLSWIQPFIETPLVPLALVLGVGLLMLPVISWMLTRVSAWMTPREMAGSERVRRVEPKLLAEGFLAFVIAWLLHGLSLGLTLRSVSAGPMDFTDWPLWTGAVSAATVAGFAAIFAPGGVGVREGLLIELLRVQPGIGEKQAVAAAVLLRLVWLSAEIAAAAALYWGVRRRAESRKR